MQERVCVRTCAPAALAPARAVCVLLCARIVCTCHHVVCVCCGCPVPHDTQEDVPRWDQQLNKAPASCPRAGSSLGTPSPCALTLRLGIKPPSPSQGGRPPGEVRSPFMTLVVSRTACDSKLIGMACCLRPALSPGCKPQGGGRHESFVPPAWLLH